MNCKGNLAAGKQKRLEEAQKEMELDTQQAFVAVALLAVRGHHGDSLPFTFFQVGLSDGSRAAKGA